MKIKTSLFVVLFLSLFITTAFGAGVVKQNYTDRHGTINLRSYQSGNTTRYYSGNGRYEGFSYQSGNRVNYYNKSAGHIGSATQINNGFRFFNSNGRPTGSSK